MKIDVDAAKRFIQNTLSSNEYQSRKRKEKEEKKRL